MKDGGVKSKIIKRYLPLMNQQINKYLQLMDFYINFSLDEEFKESVKSLYMISLFMNHSLKERR